MTKRFFIGTFAAVLMFLGVVSAHAQTSNNCRGPIYTRNEVSKPAKILNQPDFKDLHKALGDNVSARVRVDVILCRSGHVTDIHIVSSQPPNAGEFVAGALILLRFKPAEMNWHTVSQRQQFDFQFGDDWKLDAIDSSAAKGRRVEELEIIGNRRLTKEQILASIKIRPGDLYNADQIQKDLAALLATGYFNATGTRVGLEDAVRGGVRIIFEVMEVPRIVDVKFEGLKEADRSAIIEELRKQRVDIQKGAPLDDAKLKQAERIIRIFFESQGWRDVKAETLVESLSGTEVAVTFKVTAYKFGS